MMAKSTMNSPDRYMQGPPGVNTFLNLFNHWPLDCLNLFFSRLSVILPLPLEDWFELWCCKRTKNITRLTCLLCFIVVFLLGCSLYFLLGRTYITLIAFGLYFKGPLSSFGLATPYSIWEHQNFPLNNVQTEVFSKRYTIEGER